MAVIAVPPQIDDPAATKKVNFLSILKTLPTRRTSKKIAITKIDIVKKYVLVISIASNKFIDKPKKIIPV